MSDHPHYYGGGLGCLGDVLAIALVIFLLSHGSEVADAILRAIR